MRNFILLVSTTALAACGGTAPQSPGNVAPPTTGTPTPTGTFVNPSESKTYVGIGGVQHYEYSTRSDSNRQSGQLYAGDANTARNSGISITYNPRDAIFDLTINQPAGLVSTSGTRFQDPLHRTAFGGLREPQASVPRLPDSAGIQYLQAGSSTGNLLSPATPGYPTGSTYAVGADGYSSSTTTFFYQQPGTTTRYVTYAGFVRNSLSVTAVTDATTNDTYRLNNYSLDRAVFAYGERTANGAVPRSGTGTFNGDMIATMVFNPRPDVDPAAATYFQWITGSQSTVVDFASLAVNSTFTGTVGAPALDANTNHIFDMPAGSIFTASALSTVDLVGAGGFIGTVGAARFTRPDSSVFNVAIAGSSVNGAFFGPNGEEIGGGFRIVGGTPDQRIDILGAFTGRR